MTSSSGSAGVGVLTRYGGACGGRSSQVVVAMLLSLFRSDFPAQHLCPYLLSWDMPLCMHPAVFLGHYIHLIFRLPRPYPYTRLYHKLGCRARCILLRVLLTGVFRKSKATGVFLFPSSHPEKYSHSLSNYFPHTWCFKG